MLSDWWWASRFFICANLYCFAYFYLQRFGKGYPLQYSGLENSIGSIVHWVTKSWTRLSDFHFHFTFCYVSPNHLAMEVFLPLTCLVHPGCPVSVDEEASHGTKSWKILLPYHTGLNTEEKYYLHKNNHKSFCILFAFLSLQDKSCHPFLLNLLRNLKLFDTRCINFFFYIDGFLFCLLFLFLVSGGNQTHDPIIF